jgi:hypothetical protein
LEKVHFESFSIEEKKKQKNKRQGEQARQAFIVENHLSDDEQKI